MKKYQGFTLIELLVVVAIIGLLASIVLVSLAAARNKAKDARIQSDLVRLKAFAEMVYSDDISYNAICNAANNPNITHASYGTSITTLSNDINLQTAGTMPKCYASATTYCLSSVKATSASAYICVGGGGKTGTVTCAAAGTCD